MSRAPVSFKERDLIRAVKAIRKAGLKIKLVEIDKSGRIRVTTQKPRGRGGAARSNRMGQGAKP